MNFLNTTKVLPQSPHVDYQWKWMDDNADGEMKPSIMFLPLTEDGLMVNVWLRNPKSPSLITKFNKSESNLYLPYKLFLKKGEIAFLDGDVIHAGGLMPSGLRCHGYLYQSKHEKYQVNTFHERGKTNLDLNEECITPHRDYVKYKENSFSS